MKRNNGFTLIELMIVLAIIAIIGGVMSDLFINNMAWTQERATKNMDTYIRDNNIVAVRKSCAGDSDHDGYGSCNIHTDKGEEIFLQCPADFMSVKIWGATGCKEIIGQQKLFLKR